MNLELILTISINIFFVLILIVGFFVGFSRGTKRSLIHFAASAVAAIVALFTTAPITSAILKINLSASQTINDWLLNFILSLFPDLKTAMLVSPSTASFVKGLPAMVGGIAVFIVLLFLYRFVGYIIAKIIERCCLKSKKKEKELGLKRNRWAGGGIGFLKAFAFALLTFAPITALAGLANDLNNQSDSAYTTSQTTSKEENGLLSQFLPPEATISIDTYSNKTAFGIVGGLFGWDNWIFDTISVVKVDDSSISIGSELSNYIGLYNTFTEASKSLSTSSDESLKENMNWDKLDKMMVSAIDGPLFKEVVANLLADIIKNMDSFSFTSSLPQDIQDILTAIAEDLEDKDPSEYFTSDLKTIYSSISSLGRAGVLDEILFTSDTTQKIENIFTEANKESLSSSVASLFDLNTLRGASEPILNLIFKTIETESLSFGDPDTTVDDWAALKTDVKTIVGNVVSLIDDMDALSIAKDPVSILNMDSEKLSSALKLLGNTLDKVNSLEILQCTADDSIGQTVLDKLLNYFELSDIKVVDGMPANQEISTYEDLFTFLSTPIESALDLNLYNLVKNNATYDDIILHIANTLAKDSTEETFSGKLEDILLPLYQSKLIRTKLIQEQLLPAISDIELINLSALEVGEGETYDFDASFANWKGETKNLTKVLVGLTNNKAGNTSLLETILKSSDTSVVMDSLTAKVIDEAFQPMLYSKSLTGLRDQLFGEIRKAINSYTGKTTTITILADTFVEGNADDQAAEVCAILKAFLDLLPEEGKAMDLSDLSKAKPAMIALQANAARNKESDSSKSDGIFKQLYLDIYETFSADYSDNILSGQDPLTIDYENLFSLVEKLTDKSNVFGSALTEFIEKNVVDTDSLSTLLDSITTDVEESANEILDLASAFDYTIDVSSFSEMEKAAMTQTIDEKDLTDTTKAKIKALLGL